MRPQGQAKAGFYPTPSTTTALISSYIQAPTHPSRFIDPCCGDGAALSQIQDLLTPVLNSDPLKGFSNPDFSGAYSTPAAPPETFGIELDAFRAVEARRILNRVITGDFFQSRTSRHAYNLLFLNPPYDFSTDNAQRLEHKFLTEAKDLLTAGGLLILLIPQIRLIKLTARHLAAYYEHIQVFKFQEPEFQAFRQIVIFATRKADNIPNDTAQAQLEAIPAAFTTDPDTGAETSTLQPLTRQPVPAYTLPEIPENPNFYFRGFDIDPDDALKLIEENGIWTDRRRMDEIFTPRAAQEVRPLMPLKKGHLALLIASGFINNQVLDDGDLQLIIKGKSFKVSQTFSDTTTEQTEDGREKDVTITTEKEKFQTCINAFNLQTGEYMEIK